MFIAIGLVVVMGLSTIADVVGRYLFNYPIPGSVEIGTELVVAIVFLGVASVQLQRRHIRLEFLSERVSPKARSRLDLIIDVIVLAIVAVLTWRCILKAIESWQTGEISYGVVAVPYAPARTIVAFGLALLCVSVILQIYERIVKSSTKA